MARPGRSALPQRHGARHHLGRHHRRLPAARSSLALLLTLFTNFLVPFTLPPLALWLLDLDLHISAVDLSLRLALIVVLASAGAFAIRRWLGPRIIEEAPTLDGLSVVVLMVFAIPLMDGVVAQATAQPLKLAGFVVGAFAGMILCNLVVVAARCRSSTAAWR